VRSWSRIAILAATFEAHGRFEYPGSFFSGYSTLHPTPTPWPCFMSHLITIDPYSVAHLREAIDVLLVTATPIELAAVLQRLMLHPEGGPWKVYVHKETYYIGCFANRTAVVVKCDIGSSGRGAALTVCLSAIEVWRPRAVIMVGIAFGKDPKERGMCDVLVANSVIPYEVGRLGQRQYIPRAPHPPTDALLLNRFTNATDWNYRFRGATVKTRIGLLLSGEKLIDNARAKARLFRLFPHAIGGGNGGRWNFCSGRSLQCSMNFSQSHQRLRRRKEAQEISEVRCRSCGLVGGTCARRALLSRRATATCGSQWRRSRGPAASWSYNHRPKCHDIGTMGSINQRSKRRHLSQLSPPLMRRQKLEFRQRLRQGTP
jgi:nucleoside phosphorylase